MENAPREWAFSAKASKSSLGHLGSEWVGPDLVYHLRAWDCSLIEKWAGARCLCCWRVGNTLCIRNLSDDECWLFWLLSSNGVYTKKSYTERSLLLPENAVMYSARGTTDMKKRVTDSVVFSSAFLKTCSKINRRTSVARSISPVGTRGENTLSCDMVVIVCQLLWRTLTSEVLKEFRRVKEEEKEEQ